MKTKEISKHTLQRLPVYLNYLKTLPQDTVYISATALAASLSMGEVQVRKDLACVSSQGKPKVGYAKEDLIEDLEDFLGYNNTKDAVIIGAGQLGKALLGYQGFEQYGFNIVAAFDVNKELCGKTACGKAVLPIEKFGNLVKRMNIKIGIITVPAQHAQNVCDTMVKNGILAIWNFAPAVLKVPPQILLQNENMAVSLAILSKHLSKQLNKKKK